MRKEVVEYLLRDEDFRKKLVNLIADNIIRKNLLQTGLKVKDLDTGDIYILGSYDACCQQIWINTRCGSTWGRHFSNSKDPFKQLDGMNYEILLPKITIENLSELS